MQTLTNYTGIDISKKFFDVAVGADGHYTHCRFENKPSGYDLLLEVLQEGSHVSMEASGPYYLRLACYLHAKGIRISVINPLVIRRYSQMRMSRAKTDKKDARMIADYSAMMQPEQWQPPQQHVVSLQQMEAFLLGTIKRHTALSNQFESFDGSGLLEKELRKQIVKELAHTQHLIDKTTQSMEQLATVHYNQMLANLKTIPGIGNKTAMMLVVLSGGFERFDDCRNLSSYIGLCPRIFESGTSVKGKARICKMGMSAVRAALYVCSWSAKKYNKACKDLYDRLITKGKPKKLALIAVANKLLKQVFAIAKQQTKYNENYSKNICF